MDIDRLVEVCAALNREGVEYILFGGAAVNLHGIFRVTLYIDFVSRLGEMFSYDDLGAETHVVEGVPIRLATPETLDRMKRGTVRFKDRDDAANLRRKFNLPEE